MSTFFTRSLILLHHKSVSQISGKSSHFHFEIDHFTIQSLNCVMSQIFSKICYSCCVNQLTVLSLFILCILPKMWVSIYTFQNVSRILWKYLFSILSKGVKAKQYLQYPSNSHKNMFCSFFLLNTIFSTVTVVKSVGSVYTPIHRN